MSEPTTVDGGLEGDLRRYFAITTTAELPRRAAAMSVRTLVHGRVPVRGIAGAVAGLLAAAGLVLFVVAHIGVRSGAGDALSSAGAAPAGRGLGQIALIAYPGVDPARLADRGIDLQPSDGRTVTSVSAAQAQAAALAAVGGGGSAAGPAVLANANLLDRIPALRCACWVVDVRDPLRVAPAPSGAQSHTALVLIDASSGRVVAVLSGVGIP